MKRIAALLCIATMLISSAAMAKPSTNERGNHERTPRVQEKKPKPKIENNNRRQAYSKPRQRVQNRREDKPKGEIRNRNRQGERDRRQAYSKPRPRLQSARINKPKRKISSSNHRNRHSRHYTYARPRPRVQHVSHRHHRRYRSPLFSLLHWSWCSHGCH